ncbi:MAG: hypothetical protein KAW47_00205 [Thermoplasmatales archaeon]|nr:hypothetical protein [Thermoplasmatales archaeon]
MSSSTTQLDSSIDNNTPDILNAVIELVNEHGDRKGTAAELVKVLGLNITPRALSAQLKKLQEEFKNHGISITWDRKRDERIIIISNRVAVSQTEVTLRHTIQSTSQDNSFASHIEKEPITFPFSWQYGEIVELSEKEKIEVNRLRHQGRKSYQKPCVCGEEGVLEYRKTSDGNSTLLCEPCCKLYIASAIKLQQKMEKNRR